MMRTWKPWFFENSPLPLILSAFAPIDIGAITIGPLVFSRGEMSEITKNHECIHWQQYIETGVIGFLLLYVLYWLIGLIKYRDGKLAYYNIPFEKEAYENHEDIDYCLNRKRYAWFWKKI